MVDIYTTPSGQITSKASDLIDKIPKIIWTYWSQGIGKIPEFNKLCIESWRCKNPNYVIHILDDKNLRSYITIKELPKYFDEITPLQARADIIRIVLLNKYGGVWMRIVVLFA